MKRTCPICGSMDDSEEYIDSDYRTLMEEKGLCFHCSFWTNRKALDRVNDQDMIPVIVNGVHWTYPVEEVHYTKSLGWSWKPSPVYHYILFEDGRTALTNQLWCQGKIPVSFRGDFPNNAIFITLDEYTRIANLKINRDLAPISRRCPQPLLNFLLKKYDFTKNFCTFAKD